MTTLQRLSFRSFLAVTSASTFLAPALAGFGGEIPPIEGTPGSLEGTDARQIILRLLTFVLNFLALIAVVFIVIAGIRLIVSQGEEEQKNKAKKTILYVIAGLIVVLFARVIVSFFTETVPNEI